MLDLNKITDVDTFKVFGRADEEGEWREIGELLLEAQDPPSLANVASALKQRRAKLRTAAAEGTRPVSLSRSTTASAKLIERCNDGVEDQAAEEAFTGPREKSNPPCQGSAVKVAHP